MVEETCWIYLTNKRRAVVDTRIKLRVSGNAGNFFTKSHSSKYCTRWW